MMTLILGGSGSGKSAYAESYIGQLADGADGDKLDGAEKGTSSGGLAKYYLATMQVYGEEGRRKVERHREMRMGKGFMTIEQTVSVKDALDEIEDPSSSAVLLECMSNLAANEMFRENGQAAVSEVVAAITEDIRTLKDRLAHLVIVSNNVFEDGIRYDDGTMDYLRALGEVNVKLAELADEVIEVVVGIPLTIKKGR